MIITLTHSNLIPAVLSIVHSHKLITSVTTPALPPSTPDAVQCTGKTRTSLSIKWSEPACNGAAVTEYSLTCAAADAEDEQMTAVYVGPASRFKVPE